MKTKSKLKQEIERDIDAEVKQEEEMGKMKIKEKTLKVILVENPDIKRIIHRCPKCRKIPRSSFSIKDIPSCEWCLIPLDIYNIDKNGNKIPSKIKVVRLKDLK